MRAAFRAVVFALFLPLASPAHGALTDEDILVQVRKDGPVISVVVRCPVEAPTSILWDVLTDYDHMAGFISNLEYSHVERRADNLLRVRQSGKATRGPLSFSFDNVREIQLVPFSEIRSRLVSGDLLSSTFVTRIDSTGGLHIVHTGTYVPNTWVPPVIGPALIEAETRKHFAEFRAEILRRAGSAR